MVDSELGSHELVGGLEHGAEDDAAEDRAVEDLDVVHEGADVVVEGVVLCGLEPGQFLYQFGHHFLVHDADDHILDAFGDDRSSSAPGYAVGALCSKVVFVTCC